MTMNLQTSPLRARTFPPLAVSGRPAPFDLVELRPLKAPADIATVLHLRDEIDLSVHAAAGLHFEALEKKETSAAWSSRSTCTENA
jgi:hypothetical protein